MKLEGIVGTAAIKVTDLAKTLGGTTLIVTPKIGRTRGQIALPKIGITPDIMSEEGQAFHSRVKGGRLSFIPAVLERELGRIENRLRNTVEDCSLSNASGVVPISKYSELKMGFEDLRNEYFIQRDAILASWDTHLSEFEIGAKAWVLGTNLPKAGQDALLEQVLKDVPDKDTYKNSFYMKLDVKVFPVSVDATGLEESIFGDVEASWQEDVLSTAMASIEESVGKCWLLLNKAMTAGQTRATISGKTMTGLKNMADVLAWKNVFQNATLTQTRELLELIINATNLDDKLEHVESAITLLWGFATNSGIKLDVSDTLYTKEQLNDLIETFDEVA